MTRLFGEGAPIEVELAGGQPVAFFWAGGGHTVETIANRWRVAQDWWAPGGAASREYWRLATRDGLLVEIYEDLAGGGWKLARLYD